ncbi:TPA_asm: M [Bemisia tabaci-associated virus 1]|uniref:M n=1 Tax=Bemisia tabaci-associated virus 1 TaxID=3070198 RepID=A0A8D9PGW8_9RHAB|nr:M [Bemisia tabaci-associated virus 1] [Bemisia tabaci-associated virus 1]DAF42318.1 TPA_asm: M [Bemisia tabaci-associated virus 1]
MSATTNLVYSLIKCDADLEIASLKTVQNSDLLKVIVDKYKEMVKEKEARKEEIYLMLFMVWFLKEHLAQLVPAPTPRKHLGLQMATVYKVPLPNRIILFHGGINLTDITDPLFAKSNILEDSKLTMSVNLNVRQFKLKEFPESLLTKWLSSNPDTMTTNLYLEHAFKKELDSYEKKAKDKRTGLFSRLIPSSSRVPEYENIENFLK